MTLHPEFSDFPLADMPLPMPPGFHDSSWHNDTCPSYSNENYSIRIWINYVDPALREFGFEGARFAAYVETEDGDSPLIAASDNWHVILDAVAEYQAQAPLTGTCRNGKPWAECNCC